MEKLIFLNNAVWVKYWYWIHSLSYIKYFNYIKYFIYFKKLNYLFIIRFLLNFIIVKLLFKENNIDLKKSISINTYIQKGLKKQSIGIYIRNFLKNKNILYINNNYCYLIIRFARKNLFLTLLNNEGNVFCKTNIGSCGFKKKVKYTGYAIKRTSKRFSKKILASFIKTFFLNNKLYLKKLDKIKELIFINKNIKLKKLKNNMKKRKKILIIKKQRRKKTNKKQKKEKQIIKIKKKQIKKQIKRKKIINKFKKYRIYPNFNKIIKKKFKIKIRIKSNFKFWGFRFIMYGLGRRFYWFKGLENRMPIPHSKGLRLKKQRRV